MADEHFTWTELDQQYLDGAVNYDTSWLVGKLRGALARIEADRAEIESAIGYYMHTEKLYRAKIAELQSRITEDWK